MELLSQKRIKPKALEAPIVNSNSLTPPGSTYASVRERTHSLETTTSENSTKSTLITPTKRFSSMFTTHSLPQTINMKRNRHSLVIPSKNKPPEQLSSISTRSDIPTTTLSSPSPSPTPSPQCSQTSSNSNSNQTSIDLSASPKIYRKKRHSFNYHSLRKANHNGEGGERKIIPEKLLTSTTLLSPIESSRESPDKQQTPTPTPTPKGTVKRRRPRKTRSSIVIAGRYGNLDIDGDENR